MAASTKAKRLGIIAEEQNDVDVLYELTCKIVKENEFSFSRFVGHGCGKVKSKCHAWAEVLLARGCSHLVLVHDLDRCDESELRGTLEEKLRGVGFEGVLVLIPVEELEAWLLSDAAALQEVFNMQQLPKLPKWPESISDPKEYLAGIVQRYSKSVYLNTVHNKNIAKALSLSELLRCKSFAMYPKFLTNAFSQERKSEDLEN